MLLLSSFSLSSCISINNNAITSAPNCNLLQPFDLNGKTVFANAVHFNQTRAYLLQSGSITNGKVILNVSLPFFVQDFALFNELTFNANNLSVEGTIYQETKSAAIRHSNLRHKFDLYQLNITFTEFEDIKGYDIKGQLAQNKNIHAKQAVTCTYYTDSSLLACASTDCATETQGIYKVVLGNKICDWCSQAGEYIQAAIGAVRLCSSVSCAFYEHTNQCSANACLSTQNIYQIVLGKKMCSNCTDNTMKVHPGYICSTTACSTELIYKYQATINAAGVGPRLECVLQCPTLLPFNDNGICVQICATQYYWNTSTSPQILICEQTPATCNFYIPNNTWGSNVVLQQKQCLLSCFSPFTYKDSTKECVRQCPYGYDSSNNCVTVCTPNIYEELENGNKKCVSSCTGTNKYADVNGAATVCRQQCNVLPNIYINVAGTSCTNSCDAANAADPMSYSQDNLKCDTTCQFVMKSSTRKECSATCPITTPFKIQNVGGRYECIADCSSSAKKYIDSLSTMECSTCSTYFTRQVAYNINIKVCQATCANYKFTDNSETECLSQCPDTAASDSNVYRYSNSMVCSYQCAGGYYVNTTAYPQVLSCVTIDLSQFYITNITNGFKQQVPLCPLSMPYRLNRECLSQCVSGYYQEMSGGFKDCKISTDTICKYYAKVGIHKSCLGSTSSVCSIAIGQFYMITTSATDNQCVQNCSAFNKLIDLDGKSCVDACSGSGTLVGAVTYDNISCSSTCHYYLDTLSIKRCIIASCPLHLQFQKTLATGANYRYQCIADCGIDPLLKFIVSKTNLTCQNCVGFHTQFTFNGVLAYICQTTCPLALQNTDIYTDLPGSIQITNAASNVVPICLVNCTDARPYAIYEDKSCVATCPGLAYTRDIAQKQRLVCQPAAAACTQFFIVNGSQHVCISICPDNLPYFDAILGCVAACTPTYYQLIGSTKTCKLASDAVCAKYIQESTHKKCITTCGGLYNNNNACQDSCNVSPNLYIDTSGLNCIDTCNTDAKTADNLACDATCTYYIEGDGVTKRCVPNAGVCPPGIRFRVTDGSLFKCQSTCPEFVNINTLQCVAAASCSTQYIDGLVDNIVVKVCVLTCPGTLPLIDSLNAYLSIPQCVSTCSSVNKFLTGNVCGATCSNQAYNIAPNSSFVCASSCTIYNEVTVGADTYKECTSSCLYYDGVVSPFKCIPETSCQYKLVNNSCIPLASCAFYQPTQMPILCLSVCPALTYIDGKVCRQRCDGANKFISPSGTTCIATCDASLAHRFSADLQSCSTTCQFYNGTDTTTEMNCTRTTACPVDYPFLAGVQCKKALSATEYIDANQNIVGCVAGSGYVNVKINTYSVKQCVLTCPNNLMDTADANGIRICVEQCPSARPYNQNGICVTTCSSSYYNIVTAVQPLVCTVACPLFISNLTQKYCVASCPENRKYISSGECVADCDYYFPSMICAVAADCTYYKTVETNKMIVADCTGLFQLTDANGKIECVQNCPKFADGQICTATCGPKSISDSKRVCSTSYVFYLLLGVNYCVPDQSKCPETHPFLLTGAQNECVSLCASGFITSSTDLTCSTCAAGSGYTTDTVFGITVKYCLVSCTIQQPYKNEAETDGSGHFACTEKCEASAPYLEGSTCKSACSTGFYVNSGTQPQIYTCSADIPAYQYILNYLAADSQKQLINLCPITHQFRDTRECKPACPQPYYQINGQHLDCKLSTNPACQVFESTGTHNKCLGTTCPVYIDGSNCVSQCPDYVSADNYTCVGVCDVLTANKTMCDTTCRYYNDGAQKYCTENQALCPIQYPYQSATARIECLVQCPANNFVSSTLQCMAACTGARPAYYLLTVNTLNAYECVPNCVDFIDSVTNPIYNGLGQCVDHCPQFSDINSMCVATCDGIQPDLIHCQPTCRYYISNGLKLCTPNPGACPYDYPFQLQDGGRINCVANCPNNFADLSNNCLATCSTLQNTTKFNGRDITYCFATCPPAFPDSYNNKCYSSCASINLITKNGVCIPTCDAYTCGQKCVTDCAQCPEKYLDGTVCVAACPKYHLSDNSCVSTCVVHVGSLCQAVCPAGQQNILGTCQAVSCLLDDQSFCYDPLHPQDFSVKASLTDNQIKFMIALLCSIFVLIVIFIVVCCKQRKSRIKSKGDDFYANETHKAWKKCVVEKKGAIPVDEANLNVPVIRKSSNQIQHHRIVSHSDSEPRGI
ncbi:Conserved_hypothetical protein [Hexamita inflata]|uniref:Uncharacterized protein n=1 Tax=Hexamita inflata TaxID=28002 RepID=A0AA86UIS6_9EUKA|nr:Conserved hypothetical protein [Hexamita inflata]